MKTYMRNEKIEIIKKVCYNKFNLQSALRVLIQPTNNIREYPSSLTAAMPLLSGLLMFETVIPPFQGGREL